MEIFSKRMLKGILLSLMMLICISFNATAQCALGKGDLVFSGYNVLDDGVNGATQDDQFSFVFLRKVMAGTDIYFTDLGWTSANAFQTDSKAISDGIIKWTADKDYPAGTEIYINCKFQLKAYDKNNFPAGTVTGVLQTYDTRVNFPASTKEWMSLGEFSGDQIFAFTGSPAAPLLLAGISINHDNGLNNGSGWDSSLSAATFAADRSMLPAALNSGAQNLSIIQFDPADPASLIAYTARFKYTGLPTVGTAAAIVGNLNTTSNWEIRNDGLTFTPNFLAGQFFVVTGAMISSQPQDKLLVCAGTGTSFSITGTGICAYQWQVSTDNGASFSNVTDAGVYTGSATATLSISSVTGLNNYKYRVNYTDVAGVTASSAASLTLASQVITLNQTTLPDGTYNTAYSQTLTVASGGQTPYTYSVTSGTLPTGLSLSTAGVISGTPTAAGTFNFTVSVTGACVSSGSLSTSITIAKKNQTIAFAAPASQVYGAADLDPAATANSGLGITYTSADPTVATITAGQKIHIAGVGTTTITAHQAGDGNNNAAPDVSQTFTVTQKALTATAALISKVYNGDAVASVSFNALNAASGVVGSDVVSVSYTSASYDNASAGTLKPISFVGLGLSGAASVNYSLNAPGLTGTISQKPLTASYASATKTYDGNPAATVTFNPLIASSGVIGTDVVNVSYTSASYNNSGVGTSKPISFVGLGLSGAASANYSLNGIAVVGDIIPKTLTPRTNTITKVYNRNAAATVNFIPFNAGDGLVGADAVTVTYTTVAYPDANAGTGKTMVFTGLALTGPASGNYTLDASGIKGSITAVPVTVSLIGFITKIYDGTTLASLTGSNYSLSGVIPGDDAALNNPTSGTYASRNAGSSVVTVNNLALTGTSAGNYSLASGSATVNGLINPAGVIPILSGSVDKVYDGNTTASLSASNYFVAGKIGADDVALNNPLTGTYSSKNTGSRTVNVSGLVLVGADAGNYDLIRTTASTGGIISAASIVPALTGTLTKVYDGNTNAALTGVNYSFIGKIGTENVALNNPSTGAYDLKDAGSRTVTVTGLSLTGTDAGNYTLSATTISKGGTITGAIIVPVLSGPLNKVYDGNTAAVLSGTNYSFTGKIGTENVALNNPVAGTYSSKNIGNRTVTVTGLRLTGTDAANYTLAATTAVTSGTISPASIVPSLTGTITKVYDGNANAALAGANYSFTGQVATENVALNNPVSGTYDSKNIGSRTVTVNGLALTGTDAANYSLSVSSLTAPGSISAASIVPALVGPVTKVYDGNTTASLTGGNYSFTGKIGTENVSLNNPVAGAYDAKNVGNRTVSISGLALTGADAANYTLSATSLSTSGTITGASIVPALAGPVTKVYDGNVNATLSATNYSFTGKVGTDDVALNNPVAGTYSSKNVGNRTVSVSGLALTGADAANYTLSATNLSTAGTITGASIVPSLAGTITKVYDGNVSAALTAANYSFTGKAALDDVALNNPVAGAYDSKNAGNRSVNVTGLALTGADAANYSLSTTSLTAQGSITTASIVPALVGPVTKIYDGTPVANLTGANYSFTGKVGTDNVALNNPLTGTYNNKNAGTAKTVVVSGLNLTGTDAGNYTLGSTALSISTAVISPQGLTITADNKTMIQGNAVPALTLTYNGFVNGEDQSVLGGPVVVNTTATSSSLAGDYPITVSGATSGNYAITFANGIMTVKPGAPTSINLAAVTLFENRPAGTLAGTLSSTSQDPGAIFTYSLVNGTGSTDNALFSISGNQVLTAASLDYEQKSSYSILVRSTTQYGLTLDQQFTILLNDVNEAPTLNAIANSTICYTSGQQSIALSGISPGPETAQTTTLSVNSNNPSLFSDLRVTQGSGGNGTLTYRLNGNGIAGTASITVTVKDNGGTANGGVDTFTRTFVLTVNPLPVIAITSDQGTDLSKGITAKLTATGGISYVWADASGIIGTKNTAVLTVRPASTTTYTVTATNASGCSSIQTITLNVLEDYRSLQATNILTPNGDGINDRWEIKNIDMYPNNEVKIFDRAGRTLYSKKGYDNSWDGTANGAALGEGTYYYIVDFGDNKGKFKGFITLVRNQ
jgi:gliding motility-associated-like protein